MKDGKSGATKGAAKKSDAKKQAKSAATRNRSAARLDPDVDRHEESSPAPAGDTASHTPAVDEAPSLPAARGKVGVFGGPKDRGIKPEDKLALPTGPHGVYERVRSLSSKSFYCSMRWNYHVQHMTPEEVKRWWANKKLLITNSKNGAAVVVRAVDYGPHENTGLDLGISPGAAQALGVEVGDEVEIALADPKAQLGPQ